MLCRVCTRQPVRSPPARSAPAAAIALTRPEGRLSQAETRSRTLRRPWLQHKGGSASRICPGYNNQILFCIGCKDGLPWKLREGGALAFRLKLQRKEQCHLLTPSTRSGALGGKGWKTPQLTRDMAPLVTCRSQVGLYPHRRLGTSSFQGSGTLGLAGVVSATHPRFQWPLSCAR